MALEMTGGIVGRLLVTLVYIRALRRFPPLRLDSCPAFQKVKNTFGTGLGQGPCRSVLAKPIPSHGAIRKCGPARLFARSCLSRRSSFPHSLG